MIAGIGRKPARWQVRPHGLGGQREQLGDGLSIGGPGVSDEGVGDERKGRAAA